MSFSVVTDNDLHFSVLELAAILDLELKSETNEYKTTFHQILEKKDRDELISKLLSVQPYFLKNFTRKTFEASVNLYLHIVSILDPSFETDLLPSLISNIDPTKAEIDTAIPADILLIESTNIFNLVPEVSAMRYECLSLAVKLIIKENVSGLIANIAKNIQAWIVSIDNISEDQVSSLLEAIFTKYFEENEKEAFQIFESIITTNKLPLNSKFLQSFYSQILSSSKIYNTSSLAASPSFQSINNAGLSALVSEYSVGDYKSYTSNKSQYESLPINFTNLESTLKSLSILNFIASSSSTNTFTYDTLASECGIPVESVELQLITLISESLIVAKLSQASQSVIVNSVNYSGAALSSKVELVNWSEVNTLLESWKANVKNMQDVLKTLAAKQGKKINAPAFIMSFHQQKLEAKEAREKKAQQDAEEDYEANQSSDAVGVEA